MAFDYAQYQREYNRRPYVIERRKETREHRNELARKRYAYHKRNPEYVAQLKRRQVNYYISTLTKLGYTVIPPKEANE